MTRLVGEDASHYQVQHAALFAKLLHELVEAEGIKVGQVIHAVRVAVTGKAVGFGLFETLAVLGQARCLARIDRALQRV